MNKSVQKFNQVVSELDSNCQEIYKDYQAIFLASPGSKSKHQAWEGGYIDHLVETFELAEDLYTTLSSKRELPFSLAQAQTVLFLHDLEKPFKYAVKETDSETLKDLQAEAKKNTDTFKYMLIEKYNISLNDEEKNALKYIHGEGEDYQKERVMNELAVFVHTCDILSARLWYNHPTQEEKEL